MLCKHNFHRLDAGVLELVDKYERVRVKDVYPLLLTGKEILAAPRVLNKGRIFNLKTFELAQLVVQDVMDPDLINKRNRQLVSRRMDRGGCQRFGLCTQSVILHHVVLARNLTLACNVVP